MVAAGVVHAKPHRFCHTFATWTREHHARESDVPYLLGHATSALVRRTSAIYDAAKAADAYAAFSPAARLLATETSAAGSARASHTGGRQPRSADESATLRPPAISSSRPAGRSGGAADDREVLAARRVDGLVHALIERGVPDFELFDETRVVHEEEA